MVTFIFGKKGEYLRKLGQYVEFRVIMMTTTAPDQHVVTVELVRLKEAFYQSCKPGTDIYLMELGKLNPIACLTQVALTLEDLITR